MTIQRKEMVLEVLTALVIAPNEKTAEFGCLLAVARAEARRCVYVEVF